MSSNINYIVYFSNYINYKRKTKPDLVPLPYLVILSRNIKSFGCFLVLDRNKKGIIKKKLTKRLVKELVEGNKLNWFSDIENEKELLEIKDIHEELFDGKGNKEGRIRELESPDFEILKYYEF